MAKKKRESSENLSRRRFLRGLGVVSAASVAAPLVQAGAIPAAGKLPHRVLGKTGASVSIMAFGSGSRFMMYKEEDRALEALSFALDNGVTYVDTAHAYGDPKTNVKSEERVGKLMPSRRKGIFLATKIANRDPNTFWRDVEVSLKRLQVDHVDLLHIYQIALDAQHGLAQQMMSQRWMKLSKSAKADAHTVGVRRAYLPPHILDLLPDVVDVQGGVSG